MIINGRTVTLEKNSQPCMRCMGRGDVVTFVPCPTNGNGKRGGKNACRTCWGRGLHINPGVMETCPECNGYNSDKHEDETITELVRFHEWAGLVEWQVLDATTHGFNNIGLCIAPQGALYSCGDYGDHRKLTDDELIAKVRDREDSTQICNIVRRVDMRLCDGVAITRLSNGYYVKPYWKD